MNSASQCNGCDSGAGVKNYDQASATAGMLGWRLTADQVKALDAASDKINDNMGLPFEEW